MTVLYNHVYHLLLLLLLGMLCPTHSLHIHLLSLWCWFKLVSESGRDSEVVTLQRQSQDSSNLNGLNFDVDEWTKNARTQECFHVHRPLLPPVYLFFLQLEVIFHHT